MSARIIKVVFQDGTEQQESLGKHGALSDFFFNHGIDLVAPFTNVKQILFFGDLNKSWEDITADWLT